MTTSQIINDLQESIGTTEMEYKRISELIHLAYSRLESIEQKNRMETIEQESKKLRPGVLAYIQSKTWPACNNVTIGRVLDVSPSQKSFRWQDGKTKWHSLMAPCSFALKDLEFLDVCVPIVSDDQWPEETR
jgi:hypothetical protein